jgi:hypothetical protein
MATMEVAAMPVCLLRTLPIRFLRLFNTNASNLAYREEGLSFPARLTRAAQEPGRPPRCYAQHVSFSATDTHCTAKRALWKSADSRNKLPAKVFVITDHAKVLPTDELVQDMGPSG